MCGIVGALTFEAFEKKSEEKIRTEANIFITTQLLQATVERGKDATGVSLLWSDGMFHGLKMGIPSPDFIARFGETEKDFEGFLKLWREYPKLMKIFIGHCRKSSIGNSYDNKNNHPIQIGNIIMIHNGTLTNHDKIFDKLDCDRTGDVDSEAIGRLLHHYTADGNEPFTGDMLEEITRRLHGTYSVLAMSGNNPYQVAQFRDGRPAEMALVRPLKTVYVASDKKFLENVLFEYNKMCKLFVASAKFPYLKQADVEFKTLPDDSCAVWDLTAPIGDKTEIADLYDWRKTPLRVDKIWGTTYTAGGTSYNNTNRSQKKSPGTEVNAKSKSSGQGTTANSSETTGLVWSKKLDKYKTQDGITATKGCGPVTIEVESGKVTGLGTGDFDIKEVSSSKIENLVAGAAEIKELSLMRTEKVTGFLAKENLVDKKSNVKPASGVPTPAKIIEVDMTSDSEALKKAEEYVSSGLSKYESDEEVAENLNISDASVLRPMALYALANRIKKFVFKQGFMAGYIARKAENKQPDTAGMLQNQKLENAEKKICTMKLTVKILATALQYRVRGNTEAAIGALVKDAINDTLKAPKTARLDLGSAFSVGDLENIPLLKEIQSQVEEK